MIKSHKHVLMADDDEEDCMLTKLAFDETSPERTFSSVTDGVELIAYPEERSGTDQLPNLILLDLNMPRLDGRQALLNKPLLSYQVN